MGSYDDDIAGHLALHVFIANMHKLQWRKEVRHWALTVRGCAKGGDTKAIEMLAALGMQLFGSLPPWRQKIVERAVTLRELVIDPTDPLYQNDEMAVIEPLIELVANDTTTNQILKVCKIEKKDLSVRSEKLWGYEYIHWAVRLPARAYLNLTSSDKASVDS